MRGYSMEVLLLKDIKDIGFAGQVVKVKEGYARNFLFPHKLAKVATADEVMRFTSAVKQSKVEVQIAGSRVAQLAQQIENLHITIKEKANEQGKLYGAVGPDEIVELLKEKGFSINRKQVDFEKAVRSVGEYKVIVKFTSKLKPAFTLKVVAL